MRTMIIILATLFSISVMGAQMGVDTSNSNLTWTGGKLSGSSHNGTIGIKSGQVDITNGTLKSGKFVIDMESMKNSDLKSAGDKAKLIKHLKSEDFFAVSEHKTAELKVDKTEPRKDGSFLLTGTLTLRGVTKPISFPAKITKAGNVWSAKGSLNINRMDFGVKYASQGSILKRFGKIVKDKIIKTEIKLNFDIKTKNS